jgi:uncharacterized membrane protein
MKKRALVWRGPRYLLVGLGSAALGATAAYWLDPRMGHRRRMRLIDAGRRVAHEIEDVVDKGARDLAHRAHGVVAEARARVKEHGCDDEVLAARVRSELGRASSHPHAIEVKVKDGVVHLAGPILADEERAFVRQISHVRGVRHVESELDAHTDPENVPALQGGGAPRTRRFELLQDNWAPGPRLLVAAGGVLLAGYGVTRRAPLSIAAALGGLVLFARAASNLPLKRLTGIGAGRRAIDLAKDLRVDAPVPEVFAYFRAFENFPRFMAHVKRVQPLDDGRWRWRVEGPLGFEVEWIAELSALVPDRMLAWRSIPGSPLGTAGVVRFAEHEQGGTRVTIRMQYNPPAGALGHAFARLLGVDAKRELDEDLVRFKSLVEEGKATGAQGQVTRSDLPPPSNSGPTVH